MDPRTCRRDLPAPSPVPPESRRCTAGIGIARVDPRTIGETLQSLVRLPKTEPEPEPETETEPGTEPESEPESDPQS